MLFGIKLFLASMGQILMGGRPTLYVDGHIVVPRKPLPGSFRIFPNTFVL